MTETLTHLINGATVSGDVSAEHQSVDLDEVVARYPKGGAAEVNDAVKAARAAFPGWSEASPEVRSDVLDKAGSLIMGRAKDLGALLSREEGKTLPEGTGEVMRAARILKYFAGEALRRHGQTLDSTRPSIDVATYREAIGVFGLITPWNFPIAIRRGNLHCARLRQYRCASRRRLPRRSLHSRKFGRGRHSGRRVQLGHR
jgi:aldehyde dehydrogenase (NAD+)